jgi:two-component system C4-dicarboxylate transport sensor histidine kinase DctB
LREGLRQANRLATLGQVTASVAHETAQPVAAIRNYATSAALLLDRGMADEVRENLAAITRLADRIGAVTQHLRGFARKGSRGTARSRWPRRSTARG